VLTHGVGPMRQYCIGAILLDLENPTKIIARLDEPLLAPHEKEREGYVPNVVYSCGAIIHNNELVIPYAMSDINSGIAAVGVRELINCMHAVAYGCMADGKTYQEALRNAGQIIDEWIETATKLGRAIPQPKGRLAYA
jgi:hypothetical protein